MALTEEEVKKALKKLEEEKQQKEDLSSEENIKNKLKSLEIDMQAAEAMGHHIEKLEKAREMYKLIEQAQAAGFDQAAVQRLTEEINTSIESIREMSDEMKQLGPTGRKAFRKAFEATNDFGVKIGLVSNKGRKLIGGMEEIGRLAASPKGLKGLTKGITEALKPSVIMSSLFLKIAESTFKMMMAGDKASAAFAKQTGMGRKMANEINYAGTNFRNLGLTQEDAGKAAAALVDNMGQFTSQSGKVRGELVKSIAEFDKLGIGAQQGAKLVGDFMSAWKIGAGEAVALTKELAQTGAALGQSMGKTTKDFVSAQKTLAVYGVKSKKVFKDLAAQAKAANVEVSSLMAVAGKFDTFSSAADTAGKLNAILGTNISSMEMLNLKENERVEYLMRTMQANGQAFKDMDRFTQKAVAAAVGITDMNEAQKIFGMNMKDYKKYQKDMGRMAASQKEWEDALKEAMPILEKLRMVALNFAVKMAPYVEKFAAFVQKILDMSQAFGGAPAIILLTGGALGILFKLLGPFVTIFGALTSALGGTAAGSKGASKGVKKLGKASRKASKGVNKLGKGMMKVGIGFLMAGAAIFLAAAGMALFVYSFSKLKGDQLIAATIGVIAFSIAMVKFAGAMAAAGAVSISVGWAVVAVIAVIGLTLIGVIFAFNELSKTFAALTSGQLSNVAGGIVVVSLAIVGLGFAMYKLTFALMGMSAASAGMLPALGILAALGGIIAVVSLAMTPLIEQIAKLTNPEGKDPGKAISSIASAFFELAAAMMAVGLAGIFSFGGFGKMMKIMDKAIVLSEFEAKKAEAQKGSMELMANMVTDPEGAIASMKEIAQADWAAIFAQATDGISGFLGAFDFGGEKSVKIMHTLENLALIATGTSASKINASLGSKIVGVLEKMAGKDKQEQVMIVKLEPGDIEKLLKEGHARIHAYGG